MQLSSWVFWILIAITFWLLFRIGSSVRELHEEIAAIYSDVSRRLHWDVQDEIERDAR
jgi:hypothetical protein